MENSLLNKKKKRKDSKKIKIKSKNNNNNNENLHEFNINEFEKIISELAFDNSNTNEKKTSDSNIISLENLNKPSSNPLNEYNRLYSKYMTETFNINIIKLINKIIKTSKTLPNELNNNYQIQKFLLKSIKELMLNENEIIYLSIFFDNFGWKNEKLNILESFLMIGLSVKKYLNENTEIIENYLSKNYSNFMKKFSDFVNSQINFKNNLTIPPRIVNERFNELNKVYNSYCKVNYIDYNNAVDKILQMSLPYNEGIKIKNNFESNQKNNNEKVIFETNNFNENNNNNNGNNNNNNINNENNNNNNENNNINNENNNNNKNNNENNNENNNNNNNDENNYDLMLHNKKSSKINSNQFGEIFNMDLINKSSSDLSRKESSNTQFFNFIK